MKATVVGANGFLGRNLASALLERKFEVEAVYRSHHDRIPRGCTIISATQLCCDPIFTDYLFITIGNHALDHAAFKTQREFLRSILQNGSFKKVIYASSVAVYGAHSSSISETTAFSTPSAYGLAKISEEDLIVRQEDFAIVRFTYLYGTGMDPNSLLPKLCKQAKQSKCISLYGDGSRTQDYLEVSDAVELLIATALKKWNGVFIGATGSSVSNKEVAAEIAAAIGNTGIEFLNEDNTPSFIFDISKVKAELRWQPRISFKEGINRMIRNDLADL